MKVFKRLKRLLALTAMLALSQLSYADNITNQSAAIPASNLSTVTASNGSTAAGEQEANEFIKQVLYDEPNWEQIAPNAIEELLGTWVRTLFNDNYSGQISTTLLMDVLTYSNYIAIVLFMFTMMWIGYSAVLKTAAEGEVLGKSWSTIWLPLRTGVAMALMYPVQIATMATATGTSVVKVSAIQKLVVYMALVGSNAADVVWKHIAYNLPGNGVMLSETIVGKFDNTPDQVFKMLTCAHLLNSKDTTDGKLPPFVVYETVNNGYGGAGENIQPFIYGSLPDALAKINSSGKSYQLAFGGTGGECGSVTFPRVSSTGGVNSLFSVDPKNMDGKDIRDYLTSGTANEMIDGVYKNRAQEGVKLILSRTLLGVNGFAKSIAKIDSEIFTESKNDNILHTQEITIEGVEFKSSIEGIPSVAANGSYTIAQAAELYNDLLSSMAKYNRATLKGLAMKPIKLSDSSDVEVSLGSIYTQLLAARGWAVAGSYYNSIGTSSQSFNTTLSGIFDNVAVESSVSSKCPPVEFLKGEIVTMFGGSRVKSCEFDRRLNDSLGIFIELSQAYSKSKSFEDKGLGIGNILGCSGLSCKGPNVAEAINVTLNKEVSSAMSGLNSTVGATNVASSGLGLMARIGSLGRDAAAPIDAYTNFESVVHPVNAMSNIGFAFVYVGEWSFLFEKGIRIASAMLNGESFVKILVPGVGHPMNAAGGALDTLARTAMFIGTVALGYGYYLAYALPMMPVFFWTLMVIGWLVTVIEGVAAGPLAVVQLASPEGEGISGTRMERTMSLLAALLLKPTLFMFGFLASLAIGFVGFGIFNELFWTAINQDVDDATVFATYLATMILYVTGATMMIRAVYGIMHQVPNHILEWFSSGAARQFGESEVSSGVSEAASKGASGIQGAQQMGREMNRMGAQEKENQLRQAEADRAKGAPNKDTNT